MLDRPFQVDRILVGHFRAVLDRAVERDGDDGIAASGTNQLPVHDCERDRRAVRSGQLAIKAIGLERKASLKIRNRNLIAGFEVNDDFAHVGAGRILLARPVVVGIGVLQRVFIDLRILRRADDHRLLVRVLLDLDDQVGVAGRAVTVLQGVGEDVLHRLLDVKGDLLDVIVGAVAAARVIGAFKGCEAEFVERTEAIDGEGVIAAHIARSEFNNTKRNAMTEQFDLALLVANAVLA